MTWLSTAAVEEPDMVAQELEPAASGGDEAGAKAGSQSEWAAFFYLKSCHPPNAHLFELIP